MLRDKGVNGTEWSELWDLYDKNEDQVLDRDEILQIILDQLRTCKAIIKLRGDDIDVSSVVEAKTSEGLFNGTDIGPAQWFTS